MSGIKAIIISDDKKVLMNLKMNSSRRLYLGELTVSGPDENEVNKIIENELKFVYKQMAENDKKLEPKEETRGRKSKKETKVN